MWHGAVSLRIRCAHQNVSNKWFRYVLLIFFCCSLRLAMCVMPAWCWWTFHSYDWWHPCAAHYRNNLQHFCGYWLYCFVPYGLCIQNGVILISVFKKNHRKLECPCALHYPWGWRKNPPCVDDGHNGRHWIIARNRVSTGIGSETKPLAIVGDWGLISATILTLWFSLVFRLGLSQ